MLIKDFVDNELELFNKRVWNIKKTSKGTITEVNMNDRYPSVIITWDDPETPKSNYFIECLNNEIIED